MATIHAGSHPALTERNRGFASFALARLFAWHHRARSRAVLASLDERMLADIGLTRADAVAEWDKPFWR